MPNSAIVVNGRMWVPATSLLGHGQQARQFVGRQALGDLVRATRHPVGELGPVPGRVAGVVLELTKLGGSDHDLGRARAVGGEPLDGGPRQSGRRRRCRSNASLLSSVTQSSTDLEPAGRRG